MGVFCGRKGFLNMRDDKHRAFVLKTLRTPGLRGNKLYHAMKTYVDDDSLFENKDKTHAARLVVWLAWCDKNTDYSDMKWFTPCFRYLKMNTWDSKDCYSDAKSFARMLHALYKPEKKKKRCVV